MSDQTLPPAEPTPTPAEGVDVGAGEDAPPPPPPADTAVGTAPPPPPAAPRSKAGLIIGLAAGLVVLAIIAVVAVVFVVNKGEDKHSIATPSTAGGMKRDKAQESTLKQQIGAIETQFKSQAEITDVKSALYNQDDTKRGPKGLLLFLGAQIKPSAKNPAKFVKDFRKLAATNQLEVSSLAAGEGGGKALCATSKGDASESQVICAWITHDSTGELLPSVPGYNAKTLGKIMIDLRSDVEKTE